MRGVSKEALYGGDTKGVQPMFLWERDTDLGQFWNCGWYNLTLTRECVKLAKKKDKYEI
jgi:hypothetical protein